MSQLNNKDWSLVPLDKIVNAHNQLSRLLWSIFSLTMIAGLSISVLLTVSRYLDQATVFRMDYLTENYVNELPAIMICHNAHRVGYLVNHSQLSESIISYEIKSITPQQIWSTYFAKSKIYHRLKSYTVSFRSSPFQPLKLKVIEQFPKPKDQLCIDFELRVTSNETASMLNIKLNQKNPSKDDYYEIVIHNRETFPLNNYERFLYLRLMPGTNYYLFTSKQITNHLNTVRNPCATKYLEMLSRNFSYDQTICQWKHICELLQSECKCDCPLNVLHAIHSPCSSKCLKKYSRSLINTTMCPQACSKTKYSDLNLVTQIHNLANTSELNIVMSNLVSMAIEEPIYPLAKMFSEIGGLSSLLLGVSCIIVFEILEKICHTFHLFKNQKFESNHLIYPIEDRVSVAMEKESPPSFIRLSYSLSKNTTKSSLNIDINNNNNNNNLSCRKSSGEFQSYPVEIFVDNLSYRTHILTSQSFDVSAWSSTSI